MGIEIGEDDANQDVDRHAGGGNAAPKEQTQEKKKKARQGRGVTCDLSLVIKQRPKRHIETPEPKALSSCSCRQEVRSSDPYFGVLDVRKTAHDCRCHFMLGWEYGSRFPRREDAAPPRNYQDRKQLSGR
jgi:hypothetical protein